MVVYVDNMRAPFKRGPRTYIMCHMMADTLPELHAMADQIGVARRWFQDVHSGPHYDITQSKRALAVRAGAVQITLRQMAAFAWFLRTRGVAIDPVAAYAVASQERWGRP